MYEGRLYLAEVGREFLIIDAFRKATQIDFITWEDFDTQMHHFVVEIKGTPVWNKAVTRAELLEMPDPKIVLEEARPHIQRHVAQLFEKLPWSHYLWAEDWNSQRPKPELSTSVWDEKTKTWIKKG